MSEKDEANRFKSNYATLKGMGIDSDPYSKNNEFKYPKLSWTKNLLFLKRILPKLKAKISLEVMSNTLDLSPLDTTVLLNAIGIPEPKPDNTGSQIFIIEEKKEILINIETVLRDRVRASLKKIFKDSNGEKYPLTTLCKILGTTYAVEECLTQMQNEGLEVIDEKKGSQIIKKYFMTHTGTQKEAK